jgi:CubicO group peptidase (beta-lactamase class C family)
LLRRVEGVDVGEGLDRLLAASAAADSTQLRVSCGDRVLADVDGASAPLSTASVTKLVVATIVGRAAYTAGLDIDAPVAEVFPCWASADGRSAVTVRHLLGHTSGLSAGDWAAIEAGPPQDLLAVALDLPLSCAPGTRWQYNNLAVMLLPQVVAAVTDRPFLDYASEEFFFPLGIENWRWALDGTGHPLAMAGLCLNAAHLTRVGRLLLDDGRIGDTRLLPPGWVEQCTQPVMSGAPSCGLGLFWRWPNDERTGPPCCFGHDGSGGQHLWCYPASGIVIARLRDNRLPDGGYDPGTDEQAFLSLSKLGAALLP